MPRQSRRSSYSKKRIYKQRGGGMFDSFSQKANELTKSAVQKSKDMGLHDKARAAQNEAIKHATAAKKMASDVSSHAMTKGMEVHGMMKPHLDLAAGHANDAVKHAQNNNMNGFKASMGNFATGMGKAGEAGSDHITKNTKVGDASLAVHANAMGDKVTSAAKDLHSRAKSIFGFGSKPAPAAPAAPAAPVPAMGGRKSRKHSMKGRRGHRMTKNKGMKKRSYKTRKVSNSKKVLKSRTKK